MLDVCGRKGTGRGWLTGLSMIVAINAVAVLGIFFSGYDQGVMAGVNVSPDYLTVMGLGYTDAKGDVVIAPIKQGGIVAIDYLGTSVEAEKEFERLKSENKQCLHSASDAPEIVVFEKHNGFYETGAGVDHLEGSEASET